MLLFLVELVLFFVLKLGKFHGGSHIPRTMVNILKISSCFDCVTDCPDSCNELTSLKGVRNDWVYFIASPTVGENRYRA